MPNDLLSRCACTPVIETTYEEGDASPSGTVVEAVAEAEDVEPMELDPLYEVIDLDAVDRLFEGRPGESDAPSTVLAFDVRDWYVFVCDDGSILVCEPKDVPERPSVDDRVDA